MTGRVFEIREFTLHDGPGVRTTVFFKGCPLRCAWCHNPEGQQFEREAMRRRDGSVEQCGIDMEVRQLADELSVNADIMKQSGGGVTFSGGEPLAQPQFLVAVADELHNRGIHLALETSGYAAADIYRDAVSRMDFVYQDLKHHDEALFKRWCGGDLSIVLENVRFLRQSAVEHVFRVPVIPGVNDSQADRDAFLRLAGPGAKMEFLPYNAAAPAKYPMLGRDYPLGRLLNVEK